MAEFVTQMAYIEERGRLRPVMLLYMPGRERSCAPYSLAKRLEIEPQLFKTPYGWLQAGYKLEVIGHIDQRIQFQFFCARSEKIRDAVPSWVKKTMKRESQHYPWLLLDDKQYHEIQKWNGGDSEPDCVASIHDLPFSTEHRVRYYV